ISARRTSAVPEATALARLITSGAVRMSGAPIGRRVIRSRRRRRTDAGARFRAYSRGGTMIIVRFKVRCQPSRTEDVAVAMHGVVKAARSLPGVIHFDIGRDLTDSDALIATEVFEDRDAMQREEALPEVAKVVELMQGGALAGPPEWTVFEVSSSESPSR